MGKEHVVFSDHERTYRVITEEIARKLAPDAFDLSFGPQPEPAPAPIEQREKPPEQQDGSDLKHDCLNLTAFPDDGPDPRQSEPGPPAPDAPTSIATSGQKQKPKVKYTPRKTANGYGVIVPGEQDCVVDGLPTMDAAWEQIEKLKAAGSLLESEASHERR